MSPSEPNRFVVHRTLQNTASQAGKRGGPHRARLAVQANRMTTATGDNWYGQLGLGSYSAGTTTMTPVTPTWP